ncbi:MAG: hypothetical protein JWO19_6128 [Bryobacterales bacterium]|nr:hypothetical protein [Bryobacterales bacterium]
MTDVNHSTLSVISAKIKTLEKIRHAERMVDARQIARLPKDHPRRKVSLAGGGS